MVLGAVERGALSPTPQSGEATYAHKIDKAEARIDWTRPAKELDWHVRGLSPFPGAWTMYNGKRFKILHCELAMGRSYESGRYEPGQIIDQGGHLEVCCGTGGETVLRILRIQPEGKFQVSGGDFLRGYLHKSCIGFE